MSRVCHTEGFSVIRPANTRSSLQTFITCSWKQVVFIVVKSSRRQLIPEKADTVRVSFAPGRGEGTRIKQGNKPDAKGQAAGETLGVWRVRPPATVLRAGRGMAGQEAGAPPSWVLAATCAETCARPERDLAARARGQQAGGTGRARGGRWGPQPQSQRLSEACCAPGTWFIWFREPHCRGACSFHLVMLGRLRCPHVRPEGRGSAGHW